MGERCCGQRWVWRRELAVAALLVTVVGAGCAPRQAAQPGAGTPAAGTPVDATPAGGGPARAGPDAFARVQQIEASAAYREAVEQFLAGRRKADAAIRGLSLDSPSIMRVVVADTWVQQPESEREAWAVALARDFQKVRGGAGIPDVDVFMPVVRVYQQDGGIVAEVWRDRVRHYR